MKLFFAQDLNADDLYSSGLWDNIMSEMFALFRVDKQSYDAAIMPLLDRTTKKEVFEQLICSLILHCENSGWDDVEREILDRFLDFTQIAGHSKKMEVFYNLALRKAGTEAPDLSTISISSQKTILIFYGSNCGYCKQEISHLIDNYSYYKERGIDVISVSADENEQIFIKYAQTFPWKNKLCDFEGITGCDFSVYGVLGTPTIYVIDENKKIIGRHTSVEEIIQYQSWILSILRNDGE